MKNLLDNLFVFFYSLTRNNKDEDDKVISVGLGIGANALFLYLNAFFILAGLFSLPVKKTVIVYIVPIGIFLFFMFYSIKYYFKDDKYKDLEKNYEQLTSKKKSQYKYLVLIALFVLIITGGLLAPLLSYHLHNMHLIN